ncbi:MAG: YihY/virulence factor BrkB family protein, partial [Actinomycetota bacterium]
MKAVTRKVDGFLQRHPATAFPVAVFKKFGEDEAGNLAALIAYYGFFSLFPLLLVFVTILGLVLRDNPSLQQSIVDSALANFPVIGTQISRNVRALAGSGLALGIGIALTLWSGLRVGKAVQSAMNTVWNVPHKRRPNFLFSTLRAVAMLAVLGVLTLASAVAGGVGAGSSNWLWGILGIAISLVLNFALFMLAFRILTAEEVSWADVAPGAAVG